MTTSHQSKIYRQKYNEFRVSSKMTTLYPALFCRSEVNRVYDYFNPPWTFSAISILRFYCRDTIAAVDSGSFTIDLRSFLRSSLSFVGTSTPMSYILGSVVGACRRRSSTPRRHEIFREHSTLRYRRYPLQDRIRGRRQSAELLKGGRRGCRLFESRATVLRTRRQSAGTLSIYIVRDTHVMTAGNFNRADCDENSLNQPCPPWIMAHIANVVSENAVSLFLRK